MPEHISFDALKSFYDVAKEVLDLAPWDYMEEDEVFAVRLQPGEEPYFACVTGSRGISRSLVFYRGERGWHTFVRQHSGDLPPDEAIQLLDTLNLDYEPRRDVDPESRKRLKRVGWDHDAEFQPAPVAYRPGRRPTIPDARELETLTALARAALPVLRKSEEDSDWLLHGPGQNLIYHVRPGSASDLPEGEWLPPPSPPEEEYPSAPADQFAAKRIDRKTLRTCGPWEIRVGTSGAAIQDPGGAYFPMAALFVDAATGFVAGFTLATAADMPKELPQKIAASMESHGTRPQAFHVDRDDAAAWLRPFADVLKIPVVRVDRLPQADMAFKAMKDMLQKGPSGKSFR